MINWLSKLPSLKRNGNKDEFPSSELLKPFEDALGLPNVAFLVVYWICANYKKRSSTSLNVFFEKLSPLIGGYELKEAFSELIASGFIQVEQEDDDAYSITLTHNFEVALRSGEDLSQKTFISTNNSEDRMLLCIYAHAVLFKAKITALDSWQSSSYGFISGSTHSLAKIVRKVKLDRLTQSVVLFIYLMHAVESSSTEWRPLCSLFSTNRIQARRNLLQWNNPEWEPIKLGLLTTRQFSMGPLLVAPSERVQPVIYGISETPRKLISQMPPSLIKIAADGIPPKQLFYNPSEEATIKTLFKIIKRSAFKKFTRQAKKIGDQSGLTILVSGGPGTGKTELGKQLAKQSGRDLLLFNVSEQRDKYYGESEKKIKQVFDYYNSLVNEKSLEPILFFNEADSIFQARHSNDSSISNSENVVQTILLNELEKFSGILICTTNRPDSFDVAFSRRFLIQTIITPPEESTREKLLNHFFSDLPPSILQEMAAQFNFNGAEIESFNKLYLMQVMLEKKAPAKLDALREYLASKKSRTSIGFKL